MIVGTAGHIDHGKSSLVRVLTGAETDRLKAEKERGITIELGFAYWRRPGGVIGFVDVPGHERLVRTMLAGATGIDFLLLVVAADDGPMPQTREHLVIADLLGLRRGLVVLSKVDLVSSVRLREVESEIRAMLSTTTLADAACIPVSTVTGDGLLDLVLALDAAATEAWPRQTGGAFRMGIDRAFSLPGIGTIVTGTIMSGRIAVGERLIVSPAGLEVRVRSLHLQNTSAEVLEAGQRCAVAISGPSTSDAVKRGDVLLCPSLHAPTVRLDAHVQVLPGTSRTLSQWLAVRVHHGTAEVTARVIPLSSDAIAPGRAGFVQLVLDRPIAAAVGDRFVLRDISASRTIGGGRIVDLAGPERHRKSIDRLNVLKVLATSSPDVALQTLLDGLPSWVDLNRWVRDRAERPEAARALAERHDLVALPLADGATAAFSLQGWARLEAETVAVLAAFHRDHPGLPGLGREALRRALSVRLPPQVFYAVLSRLMAASMVKADRSWICLPSFEVKLSVEEEDIWRMLEPQLSSAQRFRPPRVRDLARETGIEEGLLRRILKLAARRGDVEEVATDHFFLSETVIEMADTARYLAETSCGKGFSVVDFRGKLDNGRKVAIQILEFFDRKGLTMRRGNYRSISAHGNARFSPEKETGNSLGDSISGRM